MPKKLPDYPECLETFANDLRMRILDELREGPKNVTELTTALKLERSRVSHALLELSKCSVIEAQQAGRIRTYRLRSHTPVTTKKKGTIFTILDEHRRHNCAVCHKLRT